MSLDHYVIRGGTEGRERLRLLARVMRPTTLALLDQAGLAEGMTCLDVGSGGGDVTLDMARRVGPGGRVVGVDMDDVKLVIARGEAAAEGLDNVTFRRIDAGALADAGGPYDLVFSRFLLSHLADPEGVIAGMLGRLAPGGLLVVEDIDSRGADLFPDEPALRRTIELYELVVRARGGDPELGPRLPLLLGDAGLAGVRMNVVQPAGYEGEAKLIYPITLENLVDPLLADGLASRQEIDELIGELYGLAADRRILMGMLRVVQAWGRRPG